MSTDGQRSRSLRIDAKVTREAGGSAGGGAAAGKGMTRPGEEKGDPVEKEKDDSRVCGGGSSVVCSLSLIFTPPATHKRCFNESSAAASALSAGAIPADDTRRGQTHTSFLLSGQQQRGEALADEYCAFQ